MLTFQGFTTVSALRRDRRRETLPTCRRLRRHHTTSVATAPDATDWLWTLWWDTLDLQCLVLYGDRNSYPHCVGVYGEKERTKFESQSSLTAVTTIRVSVKICVTFADGAQCQRPRFEECIDPFLDQNSFYVIRNGNSQSRTSRFLVGSYPASIQPRTIMLDYCK